MEELQEGPSLLELTFFQNPPQKALSWQVAGVSINAGKKNQKPPSNLFTRDDLSSNRPLICLLI